MTSHAYALEIENIIESVFNDQDNPLVSADLIEKYPYQYMIATLAHIYAKIDNDEIKNEIKQFDEKAFILALSHILCKLKNAVKIEIISIIRLYPIFCVNSKTQ